ncbi:hypothetical protein ACIPWF_10380 [Paenarthrobacter sp. NPDC089989]|uniref:hypothetical protein n=1 Tax=unclassified Paenarthrobacter TaxID=2634190 RepID=UPI0037F84495
MAKVAVKRSVVHKAAASLRKFMFPPKIELTPHDYMVFYYLQADNFMSIPVICMVILFVMKALDRIDPKAVVAAFKNHETSPPASLIEYFPRSFPAYRRILNPAHGAFQEMVPWALLARDGFAVDSTVQWSDVSPSASDRSISEPSMGSVDVEVAAVLQETLARHTSTPEEIYFLVWEGYAGLSDRYRLSAPVSVPYGRKMHAVLGSLSEVTSTDVASPLGVPLWWVAADGSWCVGNDVYARSVFVGGSIDCLRDISSDPKMESYAVDPALTRVVPEDL